MPNEKGFSTPHPSMFWSSYFFTKRPLRQPVAAAAAEAPKQP